MASLIDPSRPVYRRPTTASVRANFAAAKAEIEYLAGYDLPVFWAGTPGASALVAPIVMVRPVAFPVDFDGSRGKAGTPPAAGYTLDVLIDQGAGPQPAGSITVGTDGVFAFSLPDGLSLDAGDELLIVGADTPDAAIADIRLTLKGESWPEEIL